MELWQYDATDLGRLIRNGQASAREAVDSVLGRLHKVNPAINAVVRVLEDDARAHDAALVPVRVEVVPSLRLKALSLLVDKNPVPLAATCLTWARDSTRGSTAPNINHYQNNSCQRFHFKR
mgnify:CR=1 FL=1